MAKIIQKRKKKSGKKRTVYNYSKDVVIAAIKEIKEKNITLREAEAKYNVPRTTLFNRISGKYSVDVNRGAPTILSIEKENEIVDWVVGCSNVGLPVTRSRLKDAVQKYVMDSKIKTPFKGGRPGDRWFSAFMKRHDDKLRNRVPQCLTSVRAGVTEEEIRFWFGEVEAKLKKTLDVNSLDEIHASRVWNLDESAFKLVPKAEKVIAPRGARAVYQIVGSSDKATVTILLTASAEGQLAPPLVLFELKKTPSRKKLEYVPSGWGVGITESGWMTGDSFFSYIKNIYHPFLIKNSIQFPVILFVDNHGSHVTRELLLFCKEENIILVGLYKNSTHLIQPLDVAFFHPLKEEYRPAIKEFCSQNNILDFKKNMVPAVVQIALDKMDSKKALVNGFRASGLYPFNVEAVDFNILNRRKKSKKKQDDTNNTSKEEEETLPSANEQFLSYFETTLINQETLHLFQQQELNEFWEGDISLSGLFDTWKKARSMTDKRRENDSAVNHHINFDELPDIDIIPPRIPSFPQTLENNLECKTSLETNETDKIKLSFNSCTVLSPNYVDLIADDWHDGEELHDEVGNPVLVRKENDFTSLNIINSDSLNQPPLIEVKTLNNPCCTNNTSQENLSDNESCYNYGPGDPLAIPSHSFLDDNFNDDWKNNNIESTLTELPVKSIDTYDEKETALDLSQYIATNTHTQQCKKPRIIFNEVVEKRIPFKNLSNIDVPIRLNKENLKSEKSNDDSFKVPESKLKKKKPNLFTGKAAFLLDDMLEKFDREDLIQKEKEKIKAEQEEAKQTKQTKKKNQKEEEDLIKKQLCDKKKELEKKKEPIDKQLKEYKKIARRKKVENIDIILKQIESLMKDLDSIDSEINQAEIEAAESIVDIKKKYI